MATSTGRSSLSQTRKLTKHHNHLYLHDSYSPDKTDPASSPLLAPIASHERPALELRQEEQGAADGLDNVVTEIVTQVVTVVPALASAVADVAPVAADPGANNLDAPLDIPAAVPAIVSDVVGILPESTPLPQLSTIAPPGPVSTSHPPTTGSLTADVSLSQAATLTSSLSTQSSAFPTLSVPFNSTNGRFNQTLFSNTTGLRPFAIPSASSGFLNYTTLSTISVASSTAASDDAVPTFGVGSGAADGPAGAPASSDPTGGSGGDGPSKPLTPQQAGTIAGGVIGAAAGAAVLVFLVMFALKWKRRQAHLTGDGRGQRLLTSGDSNDGSGGGLSMTQESLPFSLPAAMANFASRGRYSGKTLASTSEQQPPTSEKGFYRVSGRKLPPVLQVGGDGYSDPRESVMSDGSVYYRDSTAFFDPQWASGATEAGLSPRLALGSPMRPVSGVPIMRSGPARTPVTETSSVVTSAPQTPSTVRPGGEGLGRSLTSNYFDSPGSSSRFTEEM